MDRNNFKLDRVAVAVLVFPRGTDFVPEGFSPSVGDVPRQKVGGGGQVARGLSFVLACHILISLVGVGALRRTRRPGTQGTVSCPTRVSDANWRGQDIDAGPQPVRLSAFSNALSATAGDLMAIP